MATGGHPPHDIVLTNPPYSGDHMERLLTFCRDHNKPCLLLVPSYVHQKPYFAAVHASAARTPFFVVPRKRYNYWTPRDACRGNPKVRKDGRTSPFVTLWCDHSLTALHWNADAPGLQHCRRFCVLCMLQTSDTIRCCV